MYGPVSLSTVKPCIVLFAAVCRYPLPLMTGGLLTRARTTGLLMPYKDNVYVDVYSKYIEVYHFIACTGICGLKFWSWSWFLVLPGPNTQNRNKTDPPYIFRFRHRYRTGTGTVVVF